MLDSKREAQRYHERSLEIEPKLNFFFFALYPATSSVLRKRQAYTDFVGKVNLVR